MNQNQNNFDIFINVIICINCKSVPLLAPLELPHSLGNNTPFPETQEVFIDKNGCVAYICQAKAEVDPQVVYLVLEYLCQNN